MKKISSKAGSAILVVLGMTAFLLVSAVAFSAYMRYSRLPSSYLRRSSSTRLLAKAAMARAIDAVDIAVNNNPHPGVGDQVIYRDPYLNSTIRNEWYHHVLMGTNGNWSARTTIDDNTVSPLCLEALAYIPPPLVNEARFFSRISPTARWHSLGYDAGRYSFCALDVSDYFDINRMMADVPRSSAPNRRISLAYLFEDTNHTSPGGDTAASWDQFMEQFRTLDEETLQMKYSGGKFPLVSLADFNLALYQKGGVGEFRSPFCDYVMGGSEFYGKGERALNYARMTFVTDGWMPAEELGSSSSKKDDEKNVKLYDLNDGESQPFPMDLLTRRQKTLTETLMGQGIPGAARTDWIKYFSGLDFANLCDYLDTDRVPLSLAIPTTERVPMICGIAPNLQNAVIAVDREYTPADDVKVLNGDDTERDVERTVTYKLSSQKLVPGLGTVTSLVTYPFAHPEQIAHPEQNAPTFTIGGRCSLFFSSEAMRLRTTPSDVLHLTSAELENSGVFGDKGLINLKLEEKQLNGEIQTINNAPNEEKDAVKKIEFNIAREAQAIARYLREAGNELLTVTYRWHQKKPMVGGVVAPMAKFEPEFEEVVKDPSKASEVIAHCGLKALLQGGTVDPDLQSDAKMAEFVRSGYDGGKDITLNAAIWLRVKSNENGGKVVDMVPACLFDDKSMNNVTDAQMMYQGLSGRLGRAFPLMRFDTGVKLRLSVKGLDEMAESGEQKIETTPKAALVGDPRFNYAPEHWFGTTETLTEELWLQKNGTGRADHSRDIFMATSDAGYLQSIYEFAMLPQFGNVTGPGNDQYIGNMVAIGEGNDKIADSFDAVPNNNLMWYAYDPIEDRDAFEELPWTSEGNGFKVNPYTDSTNILMSVFANTPIDWKRASTNDVEGGERYYDMSSPEFNRDYAFNEYSSDTKIAWRDLEQIAGRFSSFMRSGNKSVADAFYDLGNWTSADDSKFCGVSLSGTTGNLWDTDRKFLYGFWKECFAVKQQLFLIFVRVEPVMMGSGNAGQLPPQLGARAVALVWRDPTKSTDTQAPHQTRILFYRQFE